MRIRRLIAMFLLAGWSCGVMAAGLQVIVTADQPLETERYAADILKRDISIALGRELNIIPEREWNGKGPAIIFGNTGYAASAGVDVGQLEAEEWFIKAESKGNIIISGGLPRGAMYGAFEFLERFVGCRFFSIREKYIPPTDKIEMETDRIFRGKPFFQYRSTAHFGWNDPDEMEFRLWHKLNFILNQEHAGLYNRRVIGRHHSYYFWGRDFPSDKPEMFSQDAKGNRLRATSGAGPGQLCMTNPEVRKRIKEQIRKIIEEDSAECEKKGWEPIRVFDISQNDNEDKCVCDQCAALEKKYQHYSGVQLDFINDIAAEFPEHIIRTFAYGYTEKAPEGIVPRDNVMIHLAMLGSEFIAGRNDTMRSLNHPRNKPLLDVFNSWSKISSSIASWDYFRLFRQPYPSPYTALPMIPERFRVLAGSNVISSFFEAEWRDLGLNFSPISFQDLTVYLIMKLQTDPFLDAEAVINDYMTHYYGKAAPAMTEYLDYLQTRMKEEKNDFGRLGIQARNYYDFAFFKTVDELIAKAEKKVGDNPLYLNRIAQERIPVDFTILNLWDKLTLEAPEMKSFNRNDILERLEKNTYAAIDKYAKPGREDIYRKLKSNIANKLLALRHPIPLPTQFAGQKATQFTALTAGETYALVDDPDAAGGKAIVIPPSSPKHPNLHEKPMEIGFYDRINKSYPFPKKVFSPSDIPEDEKYHLHYLGRTRLTERCGAWAHWTWGIFLVNSALQMYSPADKDRYFDIYLSLKITGPACVKGSTSGNTVSLDRIIYVEVD